MLTQLIDNVVLGVDAAMQKASKVGVNEGSNEEEDEEDEDFLALQLPTKPVEIPRATGDKQWQGAILGPDGCIYGVPCNAGHVLRINPKTGELNIFGALPKRGWKWRGGALAPNGKIYCVPYTPAPLQVESVLNLKKPHGFEFLSDKDCLVRVHFSRDEDKRQKALSTIGLELCMAGDAIECKISALGPAFINTRQDFETEIGKLLENGRPDIPIVFKSRDAILCFNPLTEECKTFGDLQEIPSRVALDDTNGTFNGAILGSDGNVYGIPSNAKEVLMIDTKTDTISTFGYVPAGNEKWNGAVVGPDGLIYCIPSWATNILVIDPEKKKVDFFGEGLPDEAFKWSCGVLAPDNCIYCIPALSKQVLKFDPINRTTVLFGIIRGKEIKYESGFVGRDGNIFAMPVSPHTGMLCIDLKAAERMEQERIDEAARKVAAKEKAVRDAKRARELEVLKSKTCKARCIFCCKCSSSIFCSPILRCFKSTFYFACPCLKPKPKLTIRAAQRLKQADIRKELKKRKLDEPDDIHAEKQDLLARLIDHIDTENYVPPEVEEEEESEEELEPMPIWPPLVTFGDVPPGFDKWSAGIALNQDTLYPMPSGNTSSIKIEVNYTEEKKFSLMPFNVFSSAGPPEDTDEMPKVKLWDPKAEASIIDHLPGSYPEVDRTPKKSEENIAEEKMAKLEAANPSRVAVQKENGEVPDAISAMIEAGIVAGFT